MTEPWFDPVAYSYIPGVAVGLAGALVGTLTGILAPKGSYFALLNLLYVAALAGSVALLGAARSRSQRGSPTVSGTDSGWPG